MNTMANTSDASASAGLDALQVPCLQPEATTPPPGRTRMPKRAQIWERAWWLRLVRFDPMGYEHTLEPGVNFFVLALDQLGAQTSWSCEGHPHGFYVAFHATYKLARTIQSWGYFTVEIEGANYWSLRFNAPSEQAHPNKKDLDQTLNWAANAWVKGMEKMGKPFVLPSQKCS